MITININGCPVQLTDDQIVSLALAAKCCLDNPEARRSLDDLSETYSFQAWEAISVIEDAADGISNVDA